MNEVIAKIGKQTYKTTLSTSHHTIIADEPLPMGQDLGPNPYDLLLMALGSCVSMTIRMYADRKKWDLQEVEVRLTQDRVHHGDCEECESSDGYVHKIVKKVKLIGNLDEKQKSRLMEIADRCPVNRTLLNEIIISTEELN